MSFSKTLLLPEVLVLPRKLRLCTDMTEKLLTGTLNLNTNKQIHVILIFITCIMKLPAYLYIMGDRLYSEHVYVSVHRLAVRPRPSGLGEIDGLHSTSTQSCILTYDLCTGEPLRRPKPAQDEWYMIMSGHPFIKALAAYWGGAFVQGLRCHFISMPGKSPMKLEVTSRHDHSCLLGRKASKQTNEQTDWLL